MHYRRTIPALVIAFVLGCFPVSQMVKADDNRTIVVYGTCAISLVRRNDSKPAINGTRFEKIVASGRLAGSPQSITLAQLRLRWERDSLRSDPRFQNILASNSRL